MGTVAITYYILKENVCGTRLTVGVGGDFAVAQTTNNGTNSVTFGHQNQ